MIYIDDVAYHRNGVSGAGYYTVSFHDGRTSFLAVAFWSPFAGDDKDEAAAEQRIAILDQHRIASRPRLPLEGAAYRHEDYAEVVMRAISDYEERRGRDMAARGV